MEVTGLAMRDFLVELRRQLLSMISGTRVLGILHQRGALSTLCLKRAVRPEPDLAVSSRTSLRRCGSGAGRAVTRQKVGELLKAAYSPIADIRYYTECIWPKVH